MALIVVADDNQAHGSSVRALAWLDRCARYALLEHLEGWGLATPLVIFDSADDARRVDEPAGQRHG